MTILALITGLGLGLALGCVTAWLVLGERLRSATVLDTRAAALEREARELERRAIEAEAQLDAERGTLDTRVANAVKTASAAAMKESSGAFLDLAQTGAGQVSVAAGAGVTIRSSGSKLKLTGQYSAATLFRIASDEWLLVGDITT